MTTPEAPDWLRPLLGARGPRRRAAARALHRAGRPWDEVRTGLAAAFRADPAAVRPALEALRLEAGDDRLLRGRLRLYEAYATHRAGNVADAAAAYEAAARDLRAAGRADEAVNAAVAGVDALATAGRVARALALADATARALRAPALRARVAARAPAALAANRGNALRLAGDLDAAAGAYATAARGFEALGDRGPAAIARLNAGVAAVEAGDAPRGRAEIAAAAEALDALGLPDPAREARANLAWADVHAGALGDGIRALDALAAEHRDAGLPRREAVCRLDLADALRRAGDLEAAGREARRAAARFADAGAQAERAEALWLAATTAPPADAPALAREARAAARASGRAAVALRAELLAADAAARGGRRPAPRALAALARRARALGQRGLAADADLLAGGLALDAGDVVGARAALQRAARASAGRPWTRWPAEAGLAAADARRPARRRAALARARKVAGFVDGVAAGLPGAWLRARFAADRLDPWLVTVDLLLARGRPADRREAEALLDALAARRFLTARGPRGDARTRRIRARLEALYDRLARGDGPVRGEGGAGLALERRARAWERALAAGWRRAERRGAPAVAPRATPVAPPADAVALHLWRRGDRVLGLARVGDDVEGARDLGRAATWDAWATSLRARAHRWAFLRDAAPSADDAAAAEATLAEVADAVLAPLGVGHWPRDVRVTADPALPDLPWELLPCRGRRLGEGYDVLRVPTGRGGAPARGPHGRGTVVLGVGAPDLPGVGREVEAVAAALDAPTVLVGADATRAALARALATAEVVHVAGHGWDAGEAPPLAGVRVADGWFAAADLPPTVAARLVVLAACRTGRATGPAALAWGGLVTSLLARGASRVIWTTDDVDDRASADLMTAFHRARGPWDDRRAFGAAVASSARALGHPGAVLSFRLSGVSP